MPETWQWKFGEWLAATPLRRWVLRYDGQAPAGCRFVNRINGHVVVVSRASVVLAATAGDGS